MSSPGTRITEFVLASLENETVPRRIAVLSDLAEIAASSSDRKTLHAMIAALQEIERQHRQLVLDFKRRACG